MNVVNEYLKGLKKHYSYIMKVILTNDYNSKIVNEIINIYFNYRYLEYGTISAFKTEIKKLYGAEENFDKIQKAFSYITDLDDNNSDKHLIDNFNNDTIKNNSILIDLNRYIVEFLEKKDNYLNMFSSKDFELVYKKLKMKVSFVDIKSNIKISKLYSDYAIDKAFNSGLVNEDKYIIMYELLAVRILKQKIQKEKIKNYIVDIPSTYFEKNKKIIRLLDAFESELIQEHVSLRITYHDYLKYKDIIESFIKKGFKIAIQLDNTFTCDNNHIESLIIFKYILIKKDNKSYKFIKQNTFSLTSVIIELD